MTYREAWERYFEPAIKQTKEYETAIPNGRPEPVHSRGGFDPTRATKQEMNDLLDKMCGDRVYEGVKFWIPEEAAKAGIKTYNGKD